MLFRLAQTRSDLSRNKQDRNWKGYKISAKYSTYKTAALLSDHISRTNDTIMPCSIQIRSLIRIKQKE